MSGTILSIVRSIPVISKFLGSISSSWHFLSNKERELLEKMHNGNGELNAGRGSWDYKGDRKGIEMYYANGVAVFKPKDQSEGHYFTFKAYEEAQAKLVKKGYIEHRQTRMGDSCYSLTAKGQLLKKHF